MHPSGVQTAHTQMRTLPGLTVRRGSAVHVTTVRVVAAVAVFGVLAAGCNNAPSAPGAQSSVFTRHQGLTASKPTAAVGIDCSQYPNGSSCLSGYCLHIQSDPHHGYFCAQVCAGGDGTHCPAEWACQQLMPGDATSFMCVPPAGWTSQVAQAGGT